MAQFKIGEKVRVINENAYLRKNTIGTIFLPYNPNDGKYGIRIDTHAVCRVPADAIDRYDGPELVFVGESEQDISDIPWKIVAPGVDFTGTLQDCKRYVTFAKLKYYKIVHRKTGQVA